MFLAPRFRVFAKGRPWDGLHHLPSNGYPINKKGKARSDSASHYQAFLQQLPWMLQDDEEIVQDRGIRRVRVLPAPCSLLPAPCSLLPAPCSLLPAPCSLLPAPCSLCSLLPSV
jgi:hypothetical protein